MDTHCSIFAWEHFEELDICGFAFFGCNYVKQLDFTFDVFFMQCIINCYKTLIHSQQRCAFEILGIKDTIYKTPIHI